MVCDEQLLDTKVGSPRIRHQTDVTFYLNKIIMLVDKRNVVKSYVLISKKVLHEISHER